MNRLAIRTSLALVLLLLAVAVSNGVGIGSATPPNNTTGVTCLAVNMGATFSDSDCTSPTGLSIGFKHVALEENTSTIATLQGTTSTTFKGTLFAIPVSIVCTSAESGKVVLNTQGPSPGKEMYSWGTTQIVFAGCTVTSPTGSNCKVKFGVFATKPLLFTTLEEGMGVKLGPETGSTIAEFQIEGCTGSAATLNRIYAVTGSVVLTPNGALLTSTHAGTTAQESLFLGTSTIGMTTSLTMKGTVGAGAGAAISWTT